MTDFLSSFSPIVKRLRLRKYLLEIILLISALTITIISLVIFTSENQKNINQEMILNNDRDVLPEKIFIEVAGSVKNPNLYKMDFGARIKDAISIAGGLSSDADPVFFNRNYNLARIISDQEKIYVPSISEINAGIFSQNQMILDYNSPVFVNNNKHDLGLPEDMSIININIATIEELDQLPGVGQATAAKILSGRPYTAVDELLTKKVVSKGVFEKIKNLISI
jgi:competence protein ComEA